LTGGNLLEIPNFLIAASPSGLRRLIAINNTKKGRKFNYFDFSPLPGGKFICWYEEILDSIQGSEVLKAGKDAV